MAVARLCGRSEISIDGRLQSYEIIEDVCRAVAAVGACVGRPVLRDGSADRNPDRSFGRPGAECHGDPDQPWYGSGPDTDNGRGWILPVRIASARQRRKVRFSATGFKVEEFPSVTVNVAETPVLNRSLEVGQQSESVTVEAEAALLQTADSTLGNVITGTTITEMPLASRNYTQILGLEAGASSGVNNGAALGKATLDMAVNGAGKLPEQLPDGWSFGDQCVWFRHRRR